MSYDDAEDSRARVEFAKQQEKRREFLQEVRDTVRCAANDQDLKCTIRINGVPQEFVDDAIEMLREGDYVVEQSNDRLHVSWKANEQEE